MNDTQIRMAKVSELLTWYNANCPPGMSVLRFKTRQQAIDACLALWQGQQNLAAASAASAASAAPAAPAAAPTAGELDLLAAMNAVPAAAAAAAAAPVAAALAAAVPDPVQNLDAKLDDLTVAQLVDWYNFHMINPDVNPEVRALGKKDAALEACTALRQLHRLDFDRMSKTGLLAWYNAYCLAGTESRNLGSKDQGMARCEGLRDQLVIRNGAFVRLQPAAAPAAPKAPKAAGDGGDADRSAAIAASWADPETRAARSARYQIQVSGPGRTPEVYGSLMKALQATGQNVGMKTSTIQQYRMIIRDEGKAEINGLLFSLATPAAA